MITLQYLEPGPHISTISPQQVRDKLRVAFEILPIDGLLLGWDLPASLIEICKEETARSGVDLYRWHPLLTGNGIFNPQKGYRTQNLHGEPLSGFRNLPEFTFVCPNHPIAREAILAHISKVAQSGNYAGIFLDRMRFPSPAADPVLTMACFCGYCQKAAAQFGLVLGDVRRYLLKSEPIQIIHDLRNESTAKNPLAAFLKFRQHTVTQFVGKTVQVIRSAGLLVGLDCFSPSLTHLVGQDLNTLTALADWTKLMIYGHALGPATLPFEIDALTQWVISSSAKSESEVLGILNESLGLSIPKIRSKLLSSGLESMALAAEYTSGRKSTNRGKLLSGIELVEIPDVSELVGSQIESDLRALKSVQADGLSLSWDLWHMPLERLTLVAQVWGAD